MKSIFEKFLLKASTILGVLTIFLVGFFMYSQALDFTTDNTIGYIEEMFFTTDGSSQTTTIERINIDGGDGNITLTGELNIFQGKISNEKIISQDIAVGTITTNKFKDSAVNNAKVGNGAITTNKIKDGEVTGVKIGEKQVLPGKIDKTQDYKFQKLIAGTVSSKYIDPNGTSYVNSVNNEYTFFQNGISNNNVLIGTNSAGTEKLTVNGDIIATNKVCEGSYCLGDKPKEIGAMEAGKWCVVSGGIINCNKGAGVSYDWITSGWGSCSFPPMKVTASNNSIETKVKVTLGINKIVSTSYVDGATIELGNMKGTLLLRAAHHDGGYDSFHSNLRLLQNGTQIAYRGDDSSSFIPRAVTVNVNPGDILKWQHAGKRTTHASHFRYDGVFGDYEIIPGSKTRSVVCKNNSGLTVADSFCKGVKPAESENCGNTTYTWTTGTWGSCNKTCGGGTQSRSVVCKSDTGATVSDSNCTGTKPATSQSCNNQACSSYNWDDSSWSSCSVACGGGTQSRTVLCKNSSGTTVPDSNCTSTKPTTSQSCNSQSCSSYSWVLGTYGACTKTCGGGTQTRTVECKNSSGTKVSDSNCTGTKPASSQACNTQTCGKGYCTEKTFLGSTGCGGGYVWDDSKKKVVYDTSTWKFEGVAKDSKIGSAYCYEVDHPAGSGQNRGCDTWSRQGDAISGGCKTGTIGYQVFGRSGGIVAYNCLIDKPCGNYTVFNVKYGSKTNLPIYYECK